ncbi:uncharacterized protein CTRU02_206900 [Colletotrichum truncatum]|uniref:Uncharacterized protein n=1 Tax=Colletotrichum truncatum TaxID=5467 RepID=A0ACC3YZ46_COLTU|nr:uncharacterized protein CTRU02_15395 [Colletotrichum truncatum]KAF6781115.1 hypothetical protein CTRU02_15395 [Colletotrichum truncatum]
MRMGGPATTAVAIIVAVLLLLGVILIAISEHKKKKRTSARDSEQALERWEARQSVASFETVDDLKEPPPVATNMLQGRRFLFLSRNR